MRLIIDLLSQLPKWFVNLASVVVLICGLLFIYVVVDSLFISKQRYSVLGMPVGPETTFDGKPSTITMIKASHRAITTTECVKHAEKALNENGFYDVRVRGLYIFGKIKETDHLHGWAGVDCNSSSDDWVNVAISISGRESSGHLAKARLLRDYFVENTAVIGF